LFIKGNNSTAAIRNKTAGTIAPSKKIKPAAVKAKIKAKTTQIALPNFAPAPSTCFS